MPFEINDRVECDHYKEKVMSKLLAATVAALGCCLLGASPAPAQSATPRYYSYQLSTFPIEDGKPVVFVPWGTRITADHLTGKYHTVFLGSDGKAHQQHVHDQKTGRTWILDGERAWRIK